MTCWRQKSEPERVVFPDDPEVACIPAIHGFDLDLREVVTPEASLSLRGEDLVIGAAFGPILAVVNFVRAALPGRRLVRLSDSLVVAADRLVEHLRARGSLAVAELTA